MKISLVVLALAFCLPAHAQDRGQFYFAAGRFSPESNSQLANPSGQYAFVVGAGGRFSPRISWNVEYQNFEQRVDTPASFGRPGFLVSQSERSTIDTWSVNGLVKATLPLGWLDLYAGAGVGYYRSTFTVPRQALVFFEQDIKRTDSGIGAHWVAGADLRLGERWALGFQWRKASFKAAFGAEIPGEVQVGGAFGLVQLQRVF
jgi:opacity protein-like surface antigen